MDIFLTPQFERQYRKLPEKVRDKVKERIQLFRRDSGNRLLRKHKLKGDRKHLVSINITGDYRATYEKKGDSTVIFHEVGRHGQLYG